MTDWNYNDDRRRWRRPGVQAAAIIATIALFARRDARKRHVIQARVSTSVRRIMCDYRNNIVAEIISAMIAATGARWLAVRWLAADCCHVMNINLYYLISFISFVWILLLVLDL